MLCMNTPKPLSLVSDTQHNAPARLLRPSIVAARIGLSIPTIWRLRRAGDFPTPIRISKGAIGFLETDIDQWIADRANRQPARG
jgi:prophage regulatory protein